MNRTDKAKFDAGAVARAAVLPVNRIVKVKVENGVVVNAATFDSENVPDWANEWLDVPRGTGPGDTDNGDGTFARHQPPGKTDEEKDAIADQMTESDMSTPLVKTIEETFLSDPAAKEKFRKDLKKKHKAKL